MRNGQNNTKLVALYKKPLKDEEQAQAIADIVHRNSCAMNSTKPMIEFTGRTCKRVGGRCWYSSGRIIINRNGESWGLLAHELAHLNSEYARGHSYGFYQALDEIVDTMTGMAEVMQQLMATY